MNERIIELADKAVEDIPAGAWNIPDEFCEKFAELIIRECADISDASFHNGSAGYTAILKHFGVEL